ncbi:DUF1653 domain-containing protein [Thalassotalea piscium]
MKDFKLGRYQHFKGQYYQALHLAKDSETEAVYVVYQPEYGEKEIWIRPLSMFNEIVVRDGKSIQRFTKVPENNEEI